MEGQPFWLAIWLGLIAIGFVYVSAVLCQRASPFQSGNNAVLDFGTLLVLALLLYGVGPAFNWPPDNDVGQLIFRWNIAGYCIVFLRHCIGS